MTEQDIANESLRLTLQGLNTNSCERSLWEKFFKADPLELVELGKTYPEYYQAFLDWKVADYFGEAA